MIFLAYIRIISKKLNQMYIYNVQSLATNRKYDIMNSPPHHTRCQNPQYYLQQQIRAMNKNILQKQNCKTKKIRTTYQNQIFKTLFHLYFEFQQKQEKNFSRSQKRNYLVIDHKILWQNINLLKFNHYTINIFIQQTTLKQQNQMLNINVILMQHNKICSNLYFAKKQAAETNLPQFIDTTCIKKVSMSIFPCTNHVSIINSLTLFLCLRNMFNIYS
eukprot:TRINITY_DN17850_c0_g1_i1.p1 TRINITY_DN17850_c0_g1~~TRINITY_DN17850_c0_g1_i1.p1  ORF type:complete len:217 (+),score=-14.87 TRINITY_DN17850_c0_g1_i1:449-1099(+)